MPGHKVDATIARVRHSTPGVGLISPPPHHDIYSIEDLAQLIYDLKNVNRTVRSRSSWFPKSASARWPRALRRRARPRHHRRLRGRHRRPPHLDQARRLPVGNRPCRNPPTLVRERLRSRIVVQVDGGFRTGRDVVIGALLGADEFGFATAPLIAAGCIMMRKCHLNTCPVGVATQDPVLRKRFTGQPEHVINYFFFVAEEVREIMAQLGYKKFDEMVGQTQMLDQSTLVAHWKAKGLDFSKLFVRQKELPGQKIYHAEAEPSSGEGARPPPDRQGAGRARPRRAGPRSRKRSTTPTAPPARCCRAGSQIYGHAGLPPPSTSA